MPIRRTYACPECNHFIEVVLTMDQVDDPPPSCPACDAHDAMQQHFKAPGIVNSSPHSRAQALAEDIAANDYHVSNIFRDRHEGATPKVRYKDTTDQVLPSSWNGGGIRMNASELLGAAISTGRQTRLEFGSGLDVLQHNLKTGAQPDLIEASKRRSPKIW